MNSASRLCNFSEQSWLEFDDNWNIRLTRLCNKQQVLKAVKTDSILIFAQNIDCCYMLDSPHGGGSKVYPQSMFS